MNADALFEKIQGSALDVLVCDVLDYLLEQPIHSLLETSFVQKQILLSLQTFSHGEQTERWAKDMLDQLRSMAPQEVPVLDTDLLEPIQELLGFPFALDEDICLAMMQHEAIEDLMRAVLTETIEEFATKIKAITQNAAPTNVSKGLGAFRSLTDKALKSTPLGGIAQLLEKQLQFKTQEHITKSISSSIAKTASLLAAKENRIQQGSFRIHIFSTLLQTPVSVILEQVDALGTERFVQLVSTFLGRLSQNVAFQEGLSQALEQSMSLWGDKSLRTILDESGMGEAWREDTQPMLTAIAHNFIQTETFRSWLNNLVED